MSPPACFIFGAGPFFGLPVSPAPGDVVFAADGGYRHCQAAGLQPDLLLGDFDSLNDLPKGIPIHTFPVEKDDTDAMLAVRRGLELGYREFVLYGSLDGPRLDHTVANFQTLQFLADRGAVGYLVGNRSIVTVVKNASSVFA